MTAVIESTYGDPKGATAIAELESSPTASARAAARPRSRRSSPRAPTARAPPSRRSPAAEPPASPRSTASWHAPPTTRRAGRLSTRWSQLTDPSAGPCSRMRRPRTGSTRATCCPRSPRSGGSGRPRSCATSPAAEHRAIEPRIAAVHALAASPQQLVELAGVGPRDVRHATILELSALPVATLIPAAQAQTTAAASGDLWRAVTRRARAAPEERPAALAALTAALPSAGDYERRYRIVDGLATIGDADALRRSRACSMGCPPTPNAPLSRRSPRWRSRSTRAPRRCPRSRSSRAIRIRACASPRSPRSRPRPPARQVHGTHPRAPMRSTT